MLEPYAVKAARAVLRGGKFSNRPTYLARPYAALLLLIIRYGWGQILVNKVIDKIQM